MNIARNCYVQIVKENSFSRRSINLPKRGHNGLGGSLAAIYMDAVRPSFLPSHKGTKPSNPLGKVHAIITAHVPVDNTLHNKQTGEGGRAKKSSSAGA